MHLGYDKNEYGTQISVHACDVCGVSFTVCPARFPEEKREVCQVKPCASYDPACDVDLFMENGGEVVPASPRGVA